MQFSTETKNFSKFKKHSVLLSILTDLCHVDGTISRAFCCQIDIACNFISHISLILQWTPCEKNVYKEKILVCIPVKEMWLAHLFSYWSLIRLITFTTHSYIQNTYKPSRYYNVWLQNTTSLLRCWNIQPIVYKTTSIPCVNPTSSNVVQLEYFKYMHRCVFY